MRNGDYKMAVVVAAVGMESILKAYLQLKLKQELVDIKAVCQKQVDNFVVVKGMMKVVLYDGRKGSPTYKEVEEFFMGEHNPILLQIPAYVYHGFKCISENEAIVINCPTEMYDYEEPDEFRADPHGGKIPYDWSRKDG